MGLDRLHLLQAQVELPLLAQLHERRVVHRPDRHLHPLEPVGMALAELIERKRADDGLLDRVVGEDAVGSSRGEESGGPSIR